MVDGELTTDLAIIYCIVQLYERLYVEDGAWRALLDGLEYYLIADKNAEWLDKLFDNEEVLGVITGFYGNKAPGLDGPLAFS